MGAVGWAMVVQMHVFLFNVQLKRAFDHRRYVRYEKAEGCAVGGGSLPS